MVVGYKPTNVFYDIAFKYFENLQQFIKTVDTGIEEHDETIKKGICSYSEYVHAIYGVSYLLIKKYCEEFKIEFKENYNEKRLMEIISADWCVRTIEVCEKYKLT